MLSNYRAARTTNAKFKPKARGGTGSWQLKQFAEATLGSGSLKKAVLLPEGEDINEWLAVNGMFSQAVLKLTLNIFFSDIPSEPHDQTEKFVTSAYNCRTRLIFELVVDFYNQINLLYGSITEFCSPQSCPEMKATDEYAESPRNFLESVTDAQQI